MTVADFIFLPIVLFAGHLLINTVSSRHSIGSDKSLLIKLFYYHLLFSFVYAGYVLMFGGDSPGYWRAPTRFIRNDSWFSLHTTGTAFVYFLTYPFSQVFGLSFWGGTMLFSLIGYGGFVCLYLTLSRTLVVNPRLFGYKLFPLILFLPNLHFWSGGVGKDSVIFAALCLFIYSLTDIKNNIPGLIFSFYFAYFLRPHIALVMVVGLGCALLFSTRGVSIFWRSLFLVVSVVVFFLISDSVFTFIGLDREDVESLEDVASIRSQNLSRRTVGSAIEINDLPVPVKMFTFLYRPLFFDAGNLFGFVISFENFFYLLLTLSVFRFNTIKEMYRMPVFLKACFFISAATAFFMSSSLSNLGIIIRQKNMVMFMVLLILLYLISRHQYALYNRKKKRLVTMTPELKNSTGPR